MMENEDNLIKIDSSLYEEIKEIIDASPSEYPRIEDFIEAGVKRHIQSIRYNIEGGVSNITLKDGTLKPSKHILTMCMICNKTFLKDKNNLKATSRMCSKCKSNIFFFSKLLEKEEPEFNEAKISFSLLVEE